MRKIIMRAHMSPLEAVPAQKVIIRNLIGNNSGNLVFAHSVARTLMTEDTQIDTFRTSDWTDTPEGLSEVAKYYNENYDMMVLPLANAIRVSFIEDMKLMTKVIRQLTIPCVIIGVGLQATLDKDLTNERLARATAKFIRAVLKKSAMVGVRGEITGEYLKSLGFIPERDYTVIGCPSLFMYGRDLPAPRASGLTSTSRVSCNSKIQLPQNFHDFMYRSIKAIPDHYYIPQVIEEIRRMYIKWPYPEGFAKYGIPDKFPANPNSAIYKEDRGLAMTNVVSWLDFLSKADFSFGSRIHGNIAGILAGTPVHILVSDARIKELVDYHHIPHTMIPDIDENTNIFDIYEKSDFTSILDGHEARFMHFLYFLRVNGIKSIYDKEGNQKHAYFDDELKKLEFDPPVHSFAASTMAEKMRRMTLAARCRKIKQDKTETSEASGIEGSDNDGSEN